MLGSLACLKAASAVRSGHFEGMHLKSPRLSADELQSTTPPKFWLMCLKPGYTGHGTVIISQRGKGFLKIGMRLGARGT